MADKVVTLHTSLYYDNVAEFYDEVENTIKAKLLLLTLVLAICRLDPIINDTQEDKRYK